MSIKLVENSFRTSLDKGLINSNHIIDIKQLAGDASTRRYFRVTTDNSSFVVCLCGAYAFKTFTSLQDTFSKSGIPVPKIFDSDEGRGYLLQEDLGGKTLFDFLSTSNEKEEFVVYKKVLDFLAMIQKIDASKSLSKGSFDREGLFQEIEVTQNFLVEKHLKYKFSKSELDLFKEGFLNLCEESSQGDFVLNHRDFHSRNIMHGEKGPIIIDFQDARPGLAQYDLVSLLDDCYYQLSQDNVEKLKKYYFQNYIRGGDLEKFKRIYDLLSVQRLFKAVGTFAKINIERGDPGYLKYIERSFDKLIGRLDPYPEYNKLKKLLYKIKNEN